MAVLLWSQAYIGFLPQLAWLGNGLRASWHPENSFFFFLQDRAQPTGTHRALEEEGEVMLSPFPSVLSEAGG